jgi:hypothetical protein
MGMKKILPILAVVVLVIGCKSTQTGTTSSSQEGKYSEDLSAMRPKVEETTTSTTTSPTETKRDPKAYVEPKFTINKQLNALLDTIDHQNLNRKFIEGYTIQVYAGQKREDALNVKKQLTISVPGITSEVQYEQPNFKVKSGKYFTRLEAQKDFEQIKKYFPSAILVPGQISIN